MPRHGRNAGPDKTQRATRRGRWWWLCTVLGFALSVVGLLLAAHHIRRAVSRLPEFNLTIKRVELDVAKCEWLPPEARDEITSIPRAVPTFNLLSEGVLLRVRDQLGANMWVKEVCSVEKVFPDRMRFTLALRRPAAWVAIGGRWYLTDTEGVRLPVEEENFTPGHLPQIVGLPHDGRGRSQVLVPLPGRRWRSTRVAEGVCVAVYLLLKLDSPAPVRAKVCSINVSGAGGRGRGVVLTTDDDRRIEWGRTELSGTVRIVSDRKKLAGLLKILRGEPSLENSSYYLLWTEPLTAGSRRPGTGGTD